MKATQQTLQQIQRAIHKVAEKYPPTADPVMTDLHMQVKPEGGELRIFNDDMEELMRIVVDQWLEPTEDDIYEAAAVAIKQSISALRSEVEQMSILHPFSFVLMGEDEETLSDIYIVDDDQLILDTELLKGLDEELDQFLEDLLKNS